jgi:hypothetical protein
LGLLGLLLLAVLMVCGLLLQRSAARRRRHVHLLVRAGLVLRWLQGRRGGGG